MCQQHGVVFCCVRSTARNTNVIAIRSVHTQETCRKQSVSINVEVLLHATSAPIPDIKEATCVNPNFKRMQFPARNSVQAVCLCRVENRAAGVSGYIKLLV